MYLVVLVLVAMRYITPLALLIFLNFPQGVKTMKVFSNPRPDSPPDGYVGWPLWYHRFTLVHNKRFGWLYIVEIIVLVNPEEDETEYLLSTEANRTHLRDSLQQMEKKDGYVYVDDDR